MSAQIIDGKALAQAVRVRVKAEVADLVAATGEAPGLAVILAGDDPASQIYVRNKERAAAEVGVRSTVHRLPATTTEAELRALVAALNADPQVHGILVQVPLPAHLPEKEILALIDPAKDVDGFHPISIGQLFMGRPGFVSCTPAGIMELIHSTGVSLEGKEAVVVGRSNAVGKPTAALLLAENATVTVAHSRTRDLAAVCRRADVLVVAVGRRGLVKGDWVKPGAVVIDVGINRCDGKLYGDVEFAGAAERAGFITPVPGGVGPMTVAELMVNTVKAARASATH